MAIDFQMMNIYDMFEPQDSLPSRLRNLPETYNRREYFRFEEHARLPGKFAAFIQDLDKNASVPYRKDVLCAGICGPARNLYVLGLCFGYH